MKRMRTYKKKHRILKRFTIFFATFLAVLGIGWGVFAYSTIPFIQHYRELLVGTAMTTSSYRELIKFLIPRAEIERIMQLAQPMSDESTDGSDINIKTLALSKVKKELTITKMDGDHFLKIKSLFPISKKTGQVYIRDSFKGIGTSVDAAKRYKYLYKNQQRYKVEKGYDTFYVDTVEISCELFNANAIIISDPSKVVVRKSKTIGQAGEAIQSMINRNDGIGGINGGGYIGYNYGGNGAVPKGVVITNGKWYGKLIKSSNLIGFTEKDKLIIGHYSKEQLNKLKVRDAVQFYPSIIVNGKGMYTAASEAASGIHPRSAIGQTKDGSIVMLTINGRQTSSIGGSYFDEQNIFYQLGCINAVNLDGGHSSFLVFNKKLLNIPYHPYLDKQLPDAFVIKP